MVRVIQFQLNSFSTQRNIVWTPYMSAWRAGLRLRMKGGGIFPKEEKPSGDCRNYCFNRTTLSQARRNKLEIILTGGEKEQWGWSEGREKMSARGWGGAGAKAGAEEGPGREKDKGRWKVLSMHARSPNPEIISVHCLEFPPRWECEMTFQEEDRRRQAGMETCCLTVEAGGCDVG